jgi:protein-L-isoaspartate(D-aspartate) O-methyltransferase
MEAERQRMVERQLAARGVHDRAVLRAMGEVPREAFVPDELAEFAYADSPLPIEAGQTISQPYIVALMIQALELEPGDRVLEIGAGSGYAAAVMSRIAREVYTVERHGELAELARRRCHDLGYDNVHVLHGDGTLGWPDHAPFDAISVAAGGPEVPEPLLDQLAAGGRLVIPIGADPREQVLVRVRRDEHGELERESLGRVRFVPLIGAAGWAAGEAGEIAEPGAPPSAVPAGPLLAPAAHGDGAVPTLIRESAERFDDLDGADLDPLLDRIGDCRVALLGEASHGTSEFYRMRARITRELIVRRGFEVVAVEADWPDAARIDRWVRGRPETDGAGPAFARFPTWMWRNREMREFVDWLHEHNRGIADPARRVAFAGLDLYSLFASAAAVIDYLDEVDPEAARVARLRYGCLTPWERDPALYGRAAVTGRYASCEKHVVATMVEMLRRRLDYAERDGERFLDAAQNARVVAAAERYYRIMYYGGAESWNLRDRHMFETLTSLLGFRGEASKAVVWEHNSHIGDASATEMAARGELNVGMLVRERWGEGAYLVGFGTDHGTVAAASEWGGRMEVKAVRPPHPESYEHLCHRTGAPAFLLHLREPARPEVREELSEPRLERAIGVIYRPETELASHYFQAVLPRQFDEYVWFDRTEAVHPLAAAEVSGVPDTYPFGL